MVILCVSCLLGSPSLAKLIQSLEMSSSYHIRGFFPRGLPDSPVRLTYLFFYFTSPQCLVYNFTTFLTWFCHHLIALYYYC